MENIIHSQEINEKEEKVFYLQRQTLKILLLQLKQRIDFSLTGSGPVHLKMINLYGIWELIFVIT